MQTSKLTQTLQPNTRNLFRACPLAAYHAGINKNQFALAWTMCVSIASLLVITFLSPLVSHASGAADNAAVKIDFESEELLAPTGPLGKIWVSDDGVQHIRDFEVAGPVWGDINGTLTVVANINLDLATGDGTGHGTFVLDVEWNGLTGTFEGTSQWKYDGFLVSNGKGSADGTGDFEGMHMQANFFDDHGRTPLIGTILIPRGD